MLTTAGAARLTASAYDQASWPGNSTAGAALVAAALPDALLPVGIRAFWPESAAGALFCSVDGGGGDATPTSWGRQATMMKARARPLTTDAAMNIKTRPIRLIPAS